MSPEEMKAGGSVQCRPETRIARLLNLESQELFQSNLSRGVLAGDAAKLRVLPLHCADEQR